MIKIEVQSTRAVIRSQEPLTVGLTGAKARFSYGKPWEGLIKTAVFRQGEKTVVVADISTEATIPWEVLTRPGVPVQIGVYGTDSTGAIAIPTVWATTQPVRPGTDPEADPSTEPTPGLWEQLQGKLGSLEQLTTEDQSSLVAAVNEANRAVFLITVTQNEDGSYSADKTVVQLLAAQADGKVLICRLGGLWLGLSSVYNGADFEFTTVKYNTKCCVTINQDGTVSYEGMVFATTQSKLPNPKKLTVIGASKAEYDGSEDVVIGIPTKTSDLTNDSGFLTAAPVTSVNGRTGTVSIPASQPVVVTKEADGNHSVDLALDEILSAHKLGNAVFVQYGELVLPLTFASETVCVFSCVNDGSVHTVFIEGATVSVTTTSLNSGEGAAGTNGITPHIGANGNWFIGETDTGMPSRGADGLPGERGISGVYVGSGEMPAGYNIQIDPNGDTPVFVQTVNGKAPDENGNVEVAGSSGGNAYALPVATPDTLGGVKPIAKSDDMTQSVGVDENGGLWTAPGGGGSGVGNANICDFIVTSEQAVNGITVELPATLDKFYIINFGFKFADGSPAQFDLYSKQGNTCWKRVTTVTEGMIDANVFGLRYTSTTLHIGINYSDISGNAYPKMPTAVLSISNTEKTITFYSNTSGVDLPAGTSISVWGVYKQ